MHKLVSLLQRLAIAINIQHEHGTINYITLVKFPTKEKATATEKQLMGGSPSTIAIQKAEEELKNLQWDTNLGIIYLCFSFMYEQEQQSIKLMLVNHLLSHSQA